LAEGLVCVRKNRRRNLKTRESAAFLPMPPLLWRLAEVWKLKCGGSWMVPATDVSKPWQHGGPGSRALDQIRDLGARAGVAGVNLRIWRPTVATLLEGAGATDEQIQRILRHTTPLTAAQHYRKRDVPAMRSHVSKINYDAPPELIIHRGAL
jgi:integrase